MSGEHHHGLVEHRQDGSLLRRVDNFVRAAANGATFDYADKIAGALDGVVHTIARGGSIRENVHHSINAEQELTRLAREADPRVSAAGKYAGLAIGIFSGVQGVQAVRLFVMETGGLTTAAMAAARNALGLSGGMSVAVAANARAAVVVNNMVSGAQSASEAANDALTSLGALTPSATPAVAHAGGASLSGPR